MSSSVVPESDGLRHRSEGRAKNEAVSTAKPSATTGLSRQQRQVGLSKQQRMLRQMQRQSDEESAQLAVLQTIHNDALSDVLYTNLKTLGLILVLGVVALLYFAPHLLYSLWRRPDRLPNRNLLLIYPGHVEVKANLPRLFGNVAVATPENAMARTWLQQAAQIRRNATQPGPFRRRQQISLQTVEVQYDFERQLTTQSDRDRVCGMGFGRAYDNYKGTGAGGRRISPELRDRARRDLIAWCLLNMGLYDGYIHWNTTIESSLTRGLQGLVGRYVDTPRIHSAVMMAPILSQEQINQRQAGNRDVAPSTQILQPALAWLIQRGLSVQTYSSSLEDYLEEWESVLDQLIRPELQRWVILDVVCSESGRHEYDSKFRRIATIWENHGDRTTSTADRVNSIRCCAFYDPSQQPLIPWNQEDT